MLFECRDYTLLMHRGCYMKKRVWPFILIVCAVISGCGYHFAGSRNFAFRIKTLFVPVFENKTSETGIETVVTNNFIYELVRSGSVRVVDKESADAILYGTIRALSTHTISRGSIQSPFERRVVMVLDLELKDNQGRVLWRSPGFSGNESYIVLPDKVSTEGRKKQAIDTLSEKMAERVYYQLAEIGPG